MIFIPECILCGKNVDKLFLTEVEGSRIEVCENCGKYGSLIEEIRPKSRVKRTLVKKQPIPRLEEPGEILKLNYGKLIIRARQKIGLQRKEFGMKINEKESTIRRVESQQMTPEDKLRKKIENFLGIKLTEVYEEKKLSGKPDKPALTLGDIIEME